MARSPKFNGRKVHSYIHMGMKHSSIETDLEFNLADLVTFLDGMDVHLSAVSIRSHGDCNGSEVFVEWSE